MREREGGREKETERQRDRETRERDARSSRFVLTHPPTPCRGSLSLPALTRSCGSLSLSLSLVSLSLSLCLSEEGSLRDWVAQPDDPADKGICPAWSTGRAVAPP